MLTGADKVAEYIKFTDCRHFRIYQGNQRRTPVYFYEGPGGNPACVTNFNKWAELNNSNQCIEYYITIYPKGKPTAAKETADGEAAGNVKDTLIVQFYLVAPGGFQTPTAQQPQQFLGAYPGQTPEELYKKIKEEIEREYELEDLEEQVSVLQSEQTAFYANLNKLMGMAGPILDALSGKPGSAIPAARALAGVPGEPQTTPGRPLLRRVTDQPVLDATIAKLRQYDPDIDLHLEKLASIAEKKPATFDQLILMLNAM